MIFQSLLTLCFLGILVSVWRQGKRIRAIGVFVWLVIVAAIYFVWHPETLNEVAHRLGIGRGSDLMLYVFFVWVIFELLMIRVKERTHMEMITRLVRALAIHEAENAIGFHPESPSKWKTPP